MWPNPVVENIYSFIKFIVYHSRGKPKVKCVFLDISLHMDYDMLYKVLAIKNHFSNITQV
jgi:hypothetical protein